MDGWQEAWWLRRACHRARSRLIAECAEEFGIPINTMRDIHSHDSDNVKVSIPTMDTVEYDICMANNGNSVQVFDSCMNVSMIKNGVLASMHPSEGFWIFKGVHDRSQGSNAYGVAWHTDPNLPIGIPTSVIKVPMSTNAQMKEKATEKARKLMFSTACTRDSSAIVRVNMVPSFSPVLHSSASASGRSESEYGYGGKDEGEKKEEKKEDEPRPEKDQLYQFFDEAYLSVLGSLGWKRDMGVVELIPIVVGLGVV